MKNYNYRALLILILRITFRVFTTPRAYRRLLMPGVPSGSANAVGDSVGEVVFGNILLGVISLKKFLN